MPATIAELPENLRATLEKAAESSDMELIDDVIAKIRTHDAGLGDKLAMLADDWPSGIVTDEGRVASPTSLLASATVKAPEVLPLRETIAVVVPPFSEIDASAMLTDRASATSSSAHRSQTAEKMISSRPLWGAS